MAEANNPGVDKAWDILASLNPEDVCKTASVAYDPVTANYTVRSFGMDFIVSAKNRTIASASPGSEILLTRLAYFFKLSLLWYLVSAKDLTCTDRPVKLEHIKGGEIFTRGSHVLPLEAVAGKFGRDKEGFMKKGRNLGGEIVSKGDASIRLSPLPRIPVVLTLWLEDEEFPPRVELFFDSTCDLHLPVDIVWSVAMMSVLILV